MQRIHARNLYIGTTAERTALAATLPTDGIGATYYDTDDGAVYFWDGDSWNGFGTGTVAFIDLTDAPAAYTGEGGKLVKVKAAEDGLEFVAPSAGDGDVVGPAGATSGNLPTFADASGKLLQDSGIPISDLDNTSGTNTGDQVGDGITITGAGTIADPFVSAAGSGDVAGPAGAVDSNLSAFDTATGKLLKDSGRPLSNVPVSGGWLEFPAGLAYASADDPTFVVNADADVTGILNPGMRLWFQNGGGSVFGIITAVDAYAAGVTPITMYGGTDYNVANSAITAIYYSREKAPFGFPLSPVKWTVEFADDTGRTQATPTGGTWYNVGGQSITVPIGIWKLSYKFTILVADAADTLCQYYVTLSTTNNSETDKDFTQYGYERGMASGSASRLGHAWYCEKFVTLTTKTVYYPLAKESVAGIDNLYFSNADARMVLRAVCAYL